MYVGGSRQTPATPNPWKEPLKSIQAGQCDLERRTVHFCLVGLELLSLIWPGSTLASITLCVNNATQRVNALLCIDI